VNTAETKSAGNRETRERFDRLWLVRFVNLRALLLTASATAAIGATADAAMPSVAVPVLPTAPAVDGRIGPAWASAATLTLLTDFTNRRAADEPTTVRVASTVTNRSSVTGRRLRPRYRGTAMRMRSKEPRAQSPTPRSTSSASDETIAPKRSITAGAARQNAGSPPISGNVLHGRRAG